MPPMSYNNPACIGGLIAKCPASVDRLRGFFMRQRFWFRWSIAAAGVG